MERQLVVPIDAVYAPINKRVLQVGDPRKIDTWRKAFPDVDFPDIDNALTGEPMNWDSRPMDDKFVNVVLQKNLKINRRRVEVNYELDIEGIFHTIKQCVDDSERQWYLLFDGALRERGNTGKRTVQNGAKKTLVYFATQKNEYNILDRQPDTTSEEENLYRAELKNERDRMEDAVDNPSLAKVKRLSVIVPREVLDELKREANHRRRVS